MKPLFGILGALALLAPLAASAAAPELICDPDAKVVFETRWIRHSVVKLESSVNLELRWTGHEAVEAARELKSQLASSEEVPPEELSQLADDVAFVSYKDNSHGPVSNRLLIQRELLQGQENDGLVVMQQIRNNDILTNRATSKFSVFHCRSR